MTETKIKANDPDTTDLFGVSVAMDGETAVIGARFDDEAAPEAGAAYIFTRAGDGSWQQAAKLTASDPGSFDFFGNTVGIAGTTAIVGAHQADAGSVVNEGAVYVFEPDAGGSWRQTAKLIASDALSFTDFGISAVIGDGRIVVGDPRKRAVYIFERDAANSWQETFKLVASDAAINSFGWSVASSGNTIVVGAIGDNDKGTGAGAAYVFESDSGGNWQEVAKLTASDGVARELFGQEVAVSGNRILVAATRVDDLGDAGDVYVFERDMAGVWQEVAKLTASDAVPGDIFGYALVLHDNLAFIGAPGKSFTDPGAFYIFERASSGTWQEAARVEASDATVSDNFGFALATNQRELMVGAPTEDGGGINAGAVYIYREKTPKEQLSDLLLDVGALVDDERLNGGQGRALTSTLLQALASSDQEPAKAVSRLQVFIRQVMAFVQAGILTSDEGQNLIDAANTIIAQLDG